MNGANKTESFLRMNPFHTIPTLEDGVYHIGESQSELRYLARKYKPELYPRDAKLAARADWAMDALSTTIYAAFVPIAYPVLGFADPPADQGKAIEKMKEVLDMFCATFMHSEEKYICMKVAQNMSSPS